MQVTVVRKTVIYTSKTCVLNQADKIQSERWQRNILIGRKEPKIKKENKNEMVMKVYGKQSMDRRIKTQRIK